MLKLHVKDEDGIKEVGSDSLTPLLYEALNKIDRHGAIVDIEVRRVKAPDGDEIIVVKYESGLEVIFEQELTKLYAIGVDLGLLKPLDYLIYDVIAHDDEFNIDGLKRIKIDPHGVMCLFKIDDNRDVVIPINTVSKAAIKAFVNKYDSLDVAGSKLYELVKELDKKDEEYDMDFKKADDVIEYIENISKDVGYVHVVTIDGVMTLYSPLGYIEVPITEQLLDDELKQKLINMDIENVYYVPFVYDISIFDYFSREAITYKDINFDSGVIKIVIGVSDGEDDFLAFIELNYGYACIRLKEGQTAEFDDVMQSFSDDAGYEEEEDGEEEVAEDYYTIVDEITVDTLEACEQYNANKIHVIKDVVSIARLGDVVSFTVLTSCGMLYTDSLTIDGVEEKINMLDELLDAAEITPVDDTPTRLVAYHIVG